MQHHHLLLAGFGLAVLWAVCLLCRKSHPDDRASGTFIGQACDQQSAEGAGVPASGDSALIRACGGCWSILGTSPKTVFPGQRLLLSTHETCAECGAKPPQASRSLELPVLDSH